MKCLCLLSVKQKDALKIITDLMNLRNSDYFFPLFKPYKIRDVLFEFHLKFWNTASIGIPVRSLL